MKDVEGLFFLFPAASLDAFYFSASSAFLTISSMPSHSMSFHTSSPSSSVEDWNKTSYNVYSPTARIIAFIAIK